MADLVSKAEFGRLVGVGRQCVGNWVAAGKISGDALVRVGPPSGSTSPWLGDSWAPGSTLIGGSALADHRPADLAMPAALLRRYSGRGWRLKSCPTRRPAPRRLSALGAMSWPTTRGRSLAVWPGDWSPPLKAAFLNWPPPWSPAGRHLNVTPCMP
jgi:hypothetical protein